MLPQRHKLASQLLLAHKYTVLLLNGLALHTGQVLVNRAKCARYIHRQPLNCGRSFQNVAAQALYFVGQLPFVKPQNRVVVYSQALVLLAKPLVLGLLLLELHPQVEYLLRQRLKFFNGLLRFGFLFFL